MRTKFFGYRREICSSFHQLISRQFEEFVAALLSCRSTDDAEKDDNNKKSKREILAISSSGFVFRFYIIEYLITIGSHKRRCVARWLLLGTSKPDTVAVARWCANNVNPTTTTTIVNIVMEKVFVLLFLRVYRFAKRTAKSGSLAKRKEHEAWSQSLATNKTNHTIPFIFET